MIDNVIIEKFKGLKKIELQNLDDINIIIGKNDVGKSTLLESIYAFQAAALDTKGKVTHFPKILRRVRNQHARKIQHNYLSDSPTITIFCNDEEGKLTFSLDHTLSSVVVKLILPNKTRQFSLNHEFTELQSNEPAIIVEGNFEWIKQMEWYNPTAFQNMTRFRISYARR